MPPVPAAILCEQDPAWLHEMVDDYLADGLAAVAVGLAGRCSAAPYEAVVWAGMLSPAQLTDVVTGAVLLAAEAGHHLADAASDVLCGLDASRSWERACIAREQIESLIWLLPDHQRVMVQERIVSLDQRMEAA